MLFGVDKGVGGWRKFCAVLNLSIPLFFAKQKDPPYLALSFLYFLLNSKPVG